MNQYFKPNQMKRKAHQLDFISQIKKDGSGVVEVKQSLIDFMILREETLELRRLSITEDTYLAFNVNVFVVKIKNKSE